MSINAYDSTGLIDQLATISGYDDMVSLIKLRGGMVLKDFVNLGYTNDLKGLQKDIDEITQSPIPMSVKHTLVRLKVMASKADEIIIAHAG